jgi:hypothetical protein
MQAFSGLSYGNAIPHMTHCNIPVPADGDMTTKVSSASALRVRRLRLGHPAALVAPGVRLSEYAFYKDVSFPSLVDA